MLSRIDTDHELVRLYRRLSGRSQAGGIAPARRKSFFPAAIHNSAGRIDDKALEVVIPDDAVDLPVDPPQDKFSDALSSVHSESCLGHLNVVCDPHGTDPHLSRAAVERHRWIEFAAGRLATLRHGSREGSDHERCKQVPQGGGVAARQNDYVHRQQVLTLLNVGLLPRRGNDLESIGDGHDRTDNNINRDEATLGISGEEWLEGHKFELLISSQVDSPGCEACCRHHDTRSAKLTCDRCERSCLVKINLVRLSFVPTLDDDPLRLTAFGDVNVDLMNSALAVAAKLHVMFDSRFRIEHLKHQRSQPLVLRPMF